MYGNNLVYDPCSIQTQIPARIYEKDGVLTVSQGAETRTWDKTYHALKSFVHKDYVFSLHQSIDCLSYGGIKQTEVGNQQTFCLSVFNLKTESYEFMHFVDMHESPTVFRLLTDKDSQFNKFLLMTKNQ